MKWQKLFLVKRCFNGSITFASQSYKTKWLINRILKLRWIKCIIITGIMLFFLLHFRRRIIGIRSMTHAVHDASVTLVLNKSIRTTFHVEIQRIFDNQISHRNNKLLTQFSGQYREISSTSLNENITNEYSLEDIIFILTTHTKRIFTTIDYVKFWATHPGINCLIVFHEKDFMNYTNITDFLLQQGVLCEIQTSPVERFEQRYFELFYDGWKKQESDSHQNERRRIQWFAVGDDDTIWFVNNLLHVLRQHNSTDKIYLGNISTKRLQIKKHGAYYAYGGAGIVFSRSLALSYVQHRQQCERFYYTYGGDEMIGKCVVEELGVNLTRDHHFHQMDHLGNMLGLMESGMDGLVTLHHVFKSWRPFSDVQIDLVSETMRRFNIAYSTFDKSFLKRYLYINREMNQSVLLTLGYSISIFNRILTGEDLSFVEQTWCCDEMMDRRFRTAERNKTTWYFQRLINETCIDGVKYVMIYEGKKRQSDLYSTIKVTIKE
ncbi:unnamed protein product [Adineta ricciae]|uniref:Uncharacterized protein n=1 Tax=Adineta ricciae TaxID=249248 RepID=A0A814C0S1_ADIRI|nr:unnamed protein product [Adineta ricciae]CAF1159964.1 unnamed protein product [Adineta ricciae]